MHSINIQDFKNLAANSSAAILDIRDNNIFTTGHLPNAISMPVTSVPNRLNELSTNKTYYIISQNGRHSETIAQFLNKQGYKALHVSGGMSYFAEATA